MAKPDDIQEAARHFIRRYGEDAPRQAKMRADELRVTGHAEAHALWESIYRAITLLLTNASDKTRQ